MRKQNRKTVTSCRMARALALLALLTLARPTLIARGRAVGQDQAAQLEQGPTPVSVTVEPSVTIPNGRVVIKGATLMDAPGNPPVKILITRPDKNAAVPAVTLTAPLENGQFSVAFSDTDVPGEWKVRANSPGGLGHAETTFTAVAPSAPFGEMQDVAETGQELGALLKEYTAVLKTKLDSLPASPAKDEAAQKIAGAINKMGPLLPPEGPAWTEVVEALPGMRRTYGEIGRAIQPLERDLSDWMVEARRNLSGLRSEKARLTSENVRCDQIHIVIEGLKFTAFMLSFAHKPSEAILHWSKENLPPKLLALVPPSKQTRLANDTITLLWKSLATLTPAGRSLNVETVKESIHERKLKADTHALQLTDALKLTTEAAEFVAARAFEHYCESYAGPVHGKMYAQFFKEGAKWWEYSFDIDGELVLRYPKQASGKSIAVTGEFIGAGSKFRSWDDALSVHYPKLFRGAMIFRTVTEPITSAWNFIVGQTHSGEIGNWALTPNFFKIPVTGTVTDKTVTIDLMPPTKDFDFKATVGYRIFTPLAMMYGSRTSFQLPYKGAHFLIGRATGNSPMVFQVRTVGKQMIIEREFSSKRGEESIGQYSLSVKACNPSCGH